MRKTKEELDLIKKEYGVDRLYSWSMINTFMTSPYEYYLKYIAHAEEDRKDSAYAPLGGLCHDQLEKFYSDDITYEQMFENFEEGWDLNIELLDLKFNRANEEQNESVKNKYKKNIEHFFKNHVPITNDIAVEQFISTQLFGRVFQGYIDAIEHTHNGRYNIIDWKTSTIYTGETAKEKSGQLVIYAIGLMQKGIPMEKISIGWNFLKYVKVTHPLRNGKEKVRNIERYKIGSSLKNNIKTWLKAFNYVDDEIELLLNEVVNSNSLSCLPLEVRELYQIEDCYVFLDLTKELVKEWADIIKDTLTKIDMAEDKYYQTKNPAVFWDDEGNIRKESYYFANLCGYSSLLHAPYKEFLAKQDQEASLFLGETEKKEEQFDMSWLDSF